jgi:hypothetical protein
MRFQKIDFSHVQDDGQEHKVSIIIAGVNPELMINEHQGVILKLYKSMPKLPMLYILLCTRFSQPKHEPPYDNNNKVGGGADLCVLGLACLACCAE